MRFRFAPGALASGALALAALASGLATGPAAAQVQQSNPNAANQSFAIQGQFRALQQQRTADFNTLSMQAQRNVHFAPSPEIYPGAILVRPHHRGGRGVRAPRSFDMGICTGC